LLIGLFFDGFIALPDRIAYVIGTSILMYNEVYKLTHIVKASPSHKCPMYSVFIGNFRRATELVDSDGICRCGRYVELHKQLLIVGSCRQKVCPI